MKAGNIIKSIWGTELLVENEDFIGNMVNIEIPFGLNNINEISGVL
jgi:hypothetical protein